MDSCIYGEMIYKDVVRILTFSASILLTADVVPSNLSRPNDSSADNPTSLNDSNTLALGVYVTVQGGIDVWLRRRPIYPAKPACVLGPAYSAPSDPPYCHWKRATSWTRVHFVLHVSNDNRQVQQVPSSPALRARSVLRVNWRPTCLRPERLRVYVERRDSRTERTSVRRRRIEGRQYRLPNLLVVGSYIRQRRITVAVLS